MLYNQYGTLISKENPPIDELKRGVNLYLQKSSLNSDRARLYGDFTDLPMYFLHPSSYGRLSYHELRNLYEVSSSVRPAVDTLTREIQGTPWRVIYKDEKFHAGPAAEIVSDWFKRCNFDNEDISIVIGQFLNDLLIIGKGAIEKVRNPYGSIIELRAINAANITPMLDKKTNMVNGYKEYLPFESKRKYRIHSKNNIIFKNYSTVTYTYSPIPIIETIINEVSLLMLTIKNMGAAFSTDDIPPGILHLGNIGSEALERAKASFAETKSVSEKGFTMKVVDNVDEVNWVQFSRPFREMQLAELLPIIERIVARNFGLASIDAGLDGGGKTSASIGKESSRAKMFNPLTQMISLFLTNDVINEIYPDLKFTFVDTELNSVEYNKDLEAQVRIGLITINEFRVKQGLPAVKGGDQRFVLLGNEFVPLDLNTGLPNYRLPTNPGAGRPSASTDTPNPAPSTNDSQANDNTNASDTNSQK